MLTKTCPVCRSANVRRASIHRKNDAEHNGRGKKYRCRDCGRSFRVDSRFLVFLFAAVIFGTVAVVGAGFGLRALSDSLARAERAEAAARYQGLLERAKRKDPAAEYDLYRMYANGAFSTQSEGEASTWLRRAADHGSGDAQYELAVRFRDGIDVLQDYEQSFEWMKRAVESGNSKAHYSLGLMYRGGIGTEPDQVKAYVHLNLAAVNGFPEAVPLRNEIMAKLTPEQLVAAQAEARLVAQTRQ